MRLQVSLEDNFLEIAQMVTDKSVVLLIDRGLLDGSAYVDQETWDSLMDDMGTNPVRLRDDRYDAVLHMVTAADGAEQFYASLSNEARYESTGEAIEKDKKLRQAYMSHAKYSMIRNTYKDFNSKINAAKTEVQKFLDMKIGADFQSKFLLKKHVNSTCNIPLQISKKQHVDESTVIETFINYKTSEGRVLESSIEKKGANKAFTYTHKITLSATDRGSAKSVAFRQLNTLSQNS